MTDDAIPSSQKRPRKQAKGAGKRGQRVDDGSISTDDGSENIDENTKSSSDDEETKKA